jgi:intracellular septation protein
MKSQKQFFWASFLPAIAYWYLEENYTLQIALIGGLILAIIEMSLEWFITKHIHTLSKFNFFLILILGGISLVANEGIWFKLQPFFTGLLMGGYLLYKNLKDESLMVEMMKSMHSKPLPEEIILFIEKNMSVFLISYGFFMAYIALYTPTPTWLFFKTGGFYIVTVIFFITQMVFIRKKLKGLQ